MKITTAMLKVRPETLYAKIVSDGDGEFMAFTYSDLSEIEDGEEGPIYRYNLESGQAYSFQTSPRLVEID